MESYAIVKHIHMLTAIISLVGFSIRGWWMIRQNPMLEKKFVKIFPHINDTVLLAAAIYLSMISGLYPFEQSWLGVKVILLVGYIVAGTIALKKGKTQRTRIVAFIIALACILAIFAHASAKPIYW